ncbi:unnamed protein product [Phytophthora lilii]|uniref:Unnamed protein product n=1 Tax=Phytophthora lilii TaxID=2077276 RepID=A0A9W6WQT8_9STRA|nr:unnamed protein product [Phytophthora lilii]
MFSVVNYGKEKNCRRNVLSMTTFADVVLAAAAFDRDGHIHLDFDADNDNACLSICIMIVGTHGDVQPFVAIAKRLQKDGHRVRLATHAVYHDFVMSHSVEFYPLGGDPKELAAYMVKTGGHLIPLSLEAIQKDVPRNMQMIEEIIYSTWPAVSEADPDGGGPGVPGKPFRAQAIIANPVSISHPLSNMAYDRTPKKVNYMSYKLVDLLIWQGTEVNAFRTEKLDLRKIRKGDGGRDILLDLAIPHAFMWSPQLVPKPKDWGEIYDVIGTVTLEGSGSTYAPAPELEGFLGHDGGPIFVGFVSMVLQDPKGVTKMIIEAAKQANVRLSARLIHAPRVLAVVHHGGAGTTAAGLLAGKPTFIVPFFGDQAFWGRAVLDAGVGVEPCPNYNLTADKLRAAFETLGGSQLRENALKLQKIMQQEDDASEAVRVFYRNLPLHLMRCDLKMRTGSKDKLRLCKECEFVVTSRPEHSPKNIVEYTFVDYSARGPDNVLEGASSGVGALAHVFGSGVKDVFVKPAQGYHEEGAKGAVIGLAKGLGGLMSRPFVGTMVFADHMRPVREKQARKQIQRIDEAPRSHSVSFELPSVLAFNDSTKDFRGQALGKATPTTSLKNVKDKPLPKMNICMMATGSWEESIQHYVSIGLRLKADGHRVRIATNNIHRNRVGSAGLDFYPLGGSASTTTKFLQYVRQQARNKLENKSQFLSFTHHPESFSELRKLIFSLWPACVEPLVPGKDFRADTIIASPHLFGQTIVAERLGVPLHCMSSNPETLACSSYVFWNPVITEAGKEITIAGYVGFDQTNLEGNVDIATIERKLSSFAEEYSNFPLLSFGCQCDGWDQRRIRQLVTNVVFEIDQYFFPLKYILPHVKAAVHWGDISIASECLAAAKPAAVIYRRELQRLWGQALEVSGAGVEPLPADALSPFNLIHIFRTLLDLPLIEAAKNLATTFSSSDAIEAAVSAFYDNLALAGMICNLDLMRIARVYDSVHELKLSYEARLVVRQLTGDGGSAGDLKYKPLSDIHPELHLKKDVRQLQRGQSNVVEIPAFWSSPKEQETSTVEINAKYEEVLATRKASTSYRPSSLSSSSVVSP